MTSEQSEGKIAEYLKNILKFATKKQMKFFLHILPWSEHSVLSA